MKTNKYSAPVVVMRRFSEEYVAAASAVTATEDALKRGQLMVDEENVSGNPIVSIRF